MINENESKNCCCDCNIKTNIFIKLNIYNLQNILDESVIDENDREKLIKMLEKTKDMFEIVARHGPLHKELDNWCDKMLDLAKEIP